VKQDPIKHFFLEAYPNPAREGCPPTDVLRAIAANTIAPSDPACLHLAGCSPCFNEFLTFQEAHKRRIRTRWMGAVAAAALIVLGFGLYFFAFRSQRHIDPQLAADQKDRPPAKSILLTANLSRGATGSQPNAFTMATPPANLQLLLNIGSDPYPHYGAVIETAAGKIVANVHGLSSVPIQTGRAVSINISSELLPPGNYIVMLSGEKQSTETQILNLYEFTVN
jgi:hypothetical protein